MLKNRDLTLKKPDVTLEKGNGPETGRYPKPT